MGMVADRVFKIMGTEEAIEDLGSLHHDGRGKIEFKNVHFPICQTKKS